MTLSASVRRKFQPTLPARGATRKERKKLAKNFISTHAPRTGSDAQKSFAALQTHISTHAPRTGSDKAYRESPGFRHLFQPTLPARGATPRMKTCRLDEVISTHAPRTGSDVTVMDCRSCPVRFQPTLPARGATCRAVPYAPHGYSDFNPRSPHGERQLCRSPAPCCA